MIEIKTEKDVLSIIKVKRDSEEYCFFCNKIIIIIYNNEIIIKGLESLLILKLKKKLKKKKKYAKMQLQQKFLIQFAYIQEIQLQQSF